MKNMTKGAIVTGLGVALLLGGGGTLAVWNAEQSSDAGTIAAGNLDLKADNGVWTNSKGAAVNLSSYKVVPGETLIYKQPVTVTLSGGQMVATLTQTGTGLESATTGKNFDSESIEVSEVTLTKADGAQVPNELTPATDGSFLASTSFSFKDVSEQKDVLKEYDFSEVRYLLEQKPVSNPPTT